MWESKTKLGAAGGYENQQENQAAIKRCEQENGKTPDGDQLQQAGRPEPRKGRA
jgi:hypothetical protein